MSSFPNLLALSTISNLSTLKAMTIEASKQLHKRTGRKQIAVLIQEYIRPLRDNELERQGCAHIFYYRYYESYYYLSTIAIRYYLSTKYNIVVKGIDRQITAISNKRLDSLYIKARILKKELESKVFKEVLENPVINKALILLIILYNLSFRAIKQLALYALLKAANPAINREVISSYLEIKKKIYALQAISKDAVRKRLQLALLKIYFTLNIQTLLNKILLLGIYAYFIDRETQALLKALIGLQLVLSYSRDK